MSDLIKYINNELLRLAKPIDFIVKPDAPSTVNELFNSTSLVIWSGESDNTIFKDPYINYVFRALHDTFHLETGIGFTPKEEIEIGRLQAAKYDAQCKGLVAKLTYIEASLQAEYYLKHGVFVPNQLEFTEKYLSLR